LDYLLRDLVWPFIGAMSHYSHASIRLFLDRLEPVVWSVHSIC
jgi:hypothetical protein